MENTKPTITVQTTVNAPVETCWKIWTTPADILLFNSPFDDWHTAKVELDFKEQGRLYYRMEAKDGSEGFDFAGKYDRIVTNKLIEYTGDDGRKSINVFSTDGEYTIVAETFEPDATTPLDLQREFVQTLLNNFKKYVESKDIY